MRARHVALLGALAAIWGSSYLLIKYALEDLEPGVVVFLRVAVAAVVLCAVLAVRGGAARASLRDVRRRPGTAFGLGALAIALPFLLITVGELEVPSGLTAVLVAPASLFVAAFAPFLDKSEAIDRSQAVGLVVGLAGVALLVGVETISSTAQFLGAIGVLGASASYALSSFVVKSGYRGFEPLATSCISCTTATLLCVPLALATLPEEAPSLRAVLSVLALGAVHTALAFVIFYELIAETGAGRASLVAYLAPGVALVYGAVFLDEAITVAAIAGLGLILGGVGLASRPRGGGADPPEGGEVVDAAPGPGPGPGLGPAAGPARAT